MTASDSWVSVSIFLLAMAPTIIFLQNHISQVMIHLCVYGNCCVTGKIQNLVPDPVEVSGSALGNCGTIVFNPLDISWEDIVLKVEHAGSEPWQAASVFVYFTEGLFGNGAEESYDNGIFELWAHPHLNLIMQ